MRLHQKPVRKCHGCPMNLGDHCWVYQYPRGQWRSGSICRIRSDVAVLSAFEQWQKQPTVKNRKVLRREEHRGRAPVRGGEGLRWLRERGLL